MEVEVKLRLANADAHRHVTTLLSLFNVISSRRAVLCLRFYDKDKECVVSLKKKTVLVDGVSRVVEDEEDLDPKVGCDCVAERILGRVKDEFGVVGEKGFVGLGAVGEKGFVDKTDFAFGTLYEIECVSADPEEAKHLLEDLLKENGIDYSVASKFFNWLISIHMSASSVLNK